MKHGIVMQIAGRKAVVLLAGGEYKTVSAPPGWQVGQTITLRQSSRGASGLIRWVSVAAACLLLAFVTGYGIWFYSFESASLISIDVNPSVELTLNRRGKVIAVKGYNDEGTEIIRQSNLKGQDYAQAIGDLLANPLMAEFLARGEFVDFAVYTKTDNAEIYDYLQSVSDSLGREYPNTQIYCNQVDQALVQNAQNHHISAGKYNALLELQELDPSVEITDYANTSIGEIHHQIGQCRQNRGQSPGPWQEPDEDNEENENSGENQNSGQGGEPGGHHGGAASGQGQGEGQGRGQESPEGPPPRGNGHHGRPW